MLSKIHVLSRKIWQLYFCKQFNLKYLKISGKNMHGCCQKYMFHFGNSRMFIRRSSLARQNWRVGIYGCPQKFMICQMKFGNICGPIRRSSLPFLRRMMPEPTVIRAPRPWETPKTGQSASGHS